MNLRYLLVDVDGVGSFGVQPYHEIRDLIGPEGPDYVRLLDQLGMAGMVNDCGFYDPDTYPRNVVGSVLLACLGASQQPYAGPVVITGWDHSATWRGESEVRSLERFQVEALALLTADIRKVLGLEPGTPSIPAGPWAPDVLAFAEYVRSGPTPVITVIGLDEFADGAARKGGV